MFLLFAVDPMVQQQYMGFMPMNKQCLRLTTAGTEMHCAADEVGEDKLCWILGGKNLSITSQSVSHGWLVIKLKI